MQDLEELGGEDVWNEMMQDIGEKGEGFWFLPLGSTAVFGMARYYIGVKRITGVEDHIFVSVHICKTFHFRKFHLNLSLFSFPPLRTVFAPTFSMKLFQPPKAASPLVGIKFDVISVIPHIMYGVTFYLPKLKGFCS